MKLSTLIPNKYFTYIPDNLFIRLTYFQAKHKLLNTKNPRTFSEKIQWIKLYGHLEDYGIYTDKLLVREYVKRTIGQEYLIPLIGQWDTFNDIQFEDLPEKFVLKATHGSGYNFICKYKTKINKDDLKNLVNGWFSENFYTLFREAQYKNLKPRLLCENYLEDEYGELKDYKFCCFDGKPNFLEIHSGRNSEHVVEILDLNWSKLPFNTMTKDASFQTPKPKNFTKMLKIAARLSKGFPFVRIDLYSVYGKIYFGEMTFTPLEGYPYLGTTDVALGELLDLTKFKNRDKTITT
jgi:TupA-like ATPgrasp